MKTKKHLILQIQLSPFYFIPNNPKKVSFIKKFLLCSSCLSRRSSNNDYKNWQLKMLHLFPFLYSTFDCSLVSILSQINTFFPLLNLPFVFNASYITHHINWVYDWISKCLDNNKNWQKGEGDNRLLQITTRVFVLINWFHYEMKWKMVSAESFLSFLNF